MTTEITTIDYTVPAETYVAYGADFNMEAVNDAVLAELNGLVPDGVTVLRNGRVVAEGSAAAAKARDLDWDSLVKSIDLDQILASHGK
ncbi:hypothetical protein [Compostimonas suwonensis]|uniref:Uncharacterized protein n=1 Tax=Compostimonas suwonensis TaxID=1048394 RepID=A0A2M9BVY4_9MICO|nr:hypothetical protein [Compostimonas suwonensis]PJJ62113.1 hypothetical protein CLV54_1906 [Compostimonas suwonensis]